MVRKVGDIYVPDSLESETGEIVEDSGFQRSSEPVDEKSLLDTFRRWVLFKPRGSFATVLRQWIAIRLGDDNPINPGVSDPNEPPARNPTKRFRAALEEVFNSVRATQTKERKRKKG